MTSKNEWDTSKYETPMALDVELELLFYIWFYSFFFSFVERERELHSILWSTFVACFLKTVQLIKLIQWNGRDHLIELSTISSSKENDKKKKKKNKKSLCEWYSYTVYDDEMQY